LEDYVTKNLEIFLRRRPKITWVVVVEMIKDDMLNSRGAIENMTLDRTLEEKNTCAWPWVVDEYP
jgi:hypothetical protein